MSTLNEVILLFENFAWSSVPWLNPLEWVYFIQKTDSLLANTLICFFFIVCSFVFSILSGNFSMVDMLWSILPMIYAIIFAYHHPSPRVLAMMSLILLWGFRLSWNLYLKGGYSFQFEDFRWEYIRKNWVSNPILLQLFNLIFIAILQNFILLWIVCPIYVVSIQEGSSVHHSLTAFDYLAIFVALILLVLETVADLQQRAFRLERDRRNKLNIMGNSVYSTGFIQSGLWYYSRHPNFFAEFTFWWSIFSFSLITSGTNWSILGAVILTLLFQGNFNTFEFVICLISIYFF